MPKATTIHAYLKEKLKDKGMKLDNVVEKSSFSRSTIYRVFNGYQKPSDDFLTEMIELLNFNVVEQKELQYYSTLTGSDEEKASTREEIFRFIYQPEQASPEPLEMIYMDEEKYILTLNEILNRLLQLPSLQCEMHIMNCCKNEIIMPFADFLVQLNKKNISYEAEHFIEFSSMHDKDNIVTLSRILPMLCFKKYNVYYRTNESIEQEGLFYDVVFLDYQYIDDNGSTLSKHLLMSFTSNGFSTCLASDRPMTKDFIKRNIDSVRNQYTLLTNNDARTKTISDAFFELEQAYDKYLFKPNPCYDRISMEAYFHMLARTPVEQVQQFASFYTQEEVEKENATNTMMKQATLMGARQTASFNHKQVDIFTKSGLEAFISTGKLTDYIKGFPEFDSFEIALTVEEIIRRDKDKDDSYCFYILNGEYRTIDFLLSVFDGYGLVIEHHHTQKQIDEMPYCFMKHEKLSEIFIDFADNYVPNMLAMPKEESYNFLYGLLEKYNIDRVTQE